VESGGWESLSDVRAGNEECVRVSDRTSQYLRQLSLSQYGKVDHVSGIAGKAKPTPAIIPDVSAYAGTHAATSGKDRKENKYAQFFDREVEAKYQHDMDVQTDIVTMGARILKNSRLTISGLSGQANAATYYMLGVYSYLIELWGTPAFETDEDDDGRVSDLIDRAVQLKRDVKDKIYIKALQNISVVDIPGKSTIVDQTDKLWSSQPIAKSPQNFGLLEKKQRRS
jgi:hypothetical protein